jgi:hypothetical protein
MQAQGKAFELPNGQMINTHVDLNLFMTMFFGCCSISCVLFLLVLLSFVVCTALSGALFEQSKSEK